LIQEFLSPLSNQRTDAYGAHLRIALEYCARLLPPFEFVARASTAVRTHFGHRLDRWRLGYEQSVELARQLKELGADLIDCSSGGNAEHAKVPVGPGYQRPLRSRSPGSQHPDRCGGMITSPVQAEHILVTGQADAVMIARELLRDPYWPLRAAVS